jgi:hypothetical protein
LNFRYSSFVVGVMLALTCFANGDIIIFDDTYTIVGVFRSDGVYNLVGLGTWNGLPVTDTNKPTDYQAQLAQTTTFYTETRQAWSTQPTGEIIRYLQLPRYSEPRITVRVDETLTDNTPVPRNNFSRPYNGGRSTIRAGFRLCRNCTTRRTAAAPGRLASKSAPGPPSRN